MGSDKKLIKIRNSVYTITQQQEIYYHGECDGFCDTSKQLILIKSGMRELKKKSTLFHETVHCAIFEFGIKFKNAKQEEKFVEEIERLANHTLLSSFFP